MRPFSTRGVRRGWSRSSAAGVGLAAVLIAGACTEGGPGQASPSPASTAPASRGDDASPGTGAALAEEQTLRINTFFQPPSLDPALSPGNFGPNALIRQYTEPLLALEPDGTVTGAAAASFEASSDGSTYTFRLRPDGRYSDGEPVRAADFVYAWRRLIDPRTGAVQGATFAAAVAGGEEAFALDPADAGPEIDGALDDLGLRVLDEATLEVTLAAPDPNFPAVATLSAGAPLRREVVEAHGESWATSPDTLTTNGAFMVAEFDPGTRVVLVPNPQYRDAPVLTRIEAVQLAGSDIAAAWTMYLNDELDVSNGPPIASLPAALADPELQDEFLSYPEPSVQYLMFNAARAPFDQASVRRAFARSIDRATLVEGLLHGLGVPLTSLIPEDVPGHDPDLGNDLSFDADAARATLAEAGVEGADLDGLALTVPQFNTPAGEFLVAQFEQVLGVTLALDPRDDAYERAAAGDYDLCYCGFLQTTHPDPRPFFAAFTGDHPQNGTGWSDDGYDRLVAAAASEPDPAARTELYTQAHRILLEQAPVAVSHQTVRYFWVKPWVRGIVPTPYDDASFPGDLHTTEIHIAAHS